MVKPDETVGRLVDKGIDRAIAEKIVSSEVEIDGEMKRLYTLAAISRAGADRIADLGISMDDANKVVRVAGGKKSAVAKPAASSKKVADAPVITFDYVTKARQKSDLELELCAIRDRVYKDLPNKIVEEIATRLGDKYKEIPDEKKEELVIKAAEVFQRRLMAPHESAGAISAHSIGEPGTQMNLRTFHNAGVANILTTQGLPRLLEIMGIRLTSTPSMDIPLKGLAKEDKEVARQIANQIEATKLLDIADVDTDTTSMCVVIRPNMSRMDKRGITINDLVRKLRENRALKTLPIEVSEPGKEIDPFVIDHPVSTYTITVSCPPDVYSFKVLQAISKSVRASVIKGIDEVERAIIIEDKDSGGWKIATQGSNLKAVLEIEGVDAVRVRTNRIPEIEEVLGIEAARNSIIEEMVATLEAAGLTVDVRHIMLEADVLTGNGYLRSIGWYGLSTRKSSVLAKASFEYVFDTIWRAAMYGEIDEIAGVSENIIVGQPVTIGTGAVNVIYKPKNNTQQGDEE